MYYQVRIQYRTQGGHYAHAEFVPPLGVVLGQKYVEDFVLSTLPEGANIVAVKLLRSRTGPQDVVIKNIFQAASYAAQ